VPDDGRSRHRKAVGDAVRQVRQERGMSIRDLAAILDVDYRQVARIERGEAAAELDLVAELAGAFECPPWMFLQSLPGVSETVSGADFVERMESLALQTVGAQWQRAADREAAVRVVKAMVALPTPALEELARNVEARAAVEEGALTVPLFHMPLRETHHR
jgi:transcriptional regulator with XRE-family HTH domain